MNANHIRELGLAALSGSMPFAEIVGKLIAEGVEYYHVDYLALQFRFYSTEGGIAVVPLSFASPLPAVAADFDVPALKAAILDSQKHGQKFLDFSRRAVTAGVAGYFAYLRGQRVLYLGRQGDNHVEWFPDAKPASS